jgi:hypothetical protein
MIACILLRSVIVAGIALAMNHVKGGILMKLSQKRALFSYNIALLVTWATEQGFNVCFDDVKAKTGHMNNSLHYDGTAADIILYDANWNYLTDTEDYRELGEKWEELHENCYWGGYTRRDDQGTALTKDGNHFSMSWDKRR